MKTEFKNKTVVITGGAGILGSGFSQALLEWGARVAILDINVDDLSLLDQFEGQYIAIKTDVLSKESIEAAAAEVIQKYGKIDILINGAGGNNPGSTTSPSQSFFDLPQESLQFVSDLNLLGTFLPSQVFGKLMAGAKKGIILNISSMTAFQPLTRVVAYSAAKAGISNFTQWLAVHMALEYSPEIRVNAIAPGFFLTQQNKFLLTDEKTGELTGRGKQIIDHTPMGRFGDPEDLLGALEWLLSEKSKFVTGIVLPVDGGFSAYSGV